MNHRLHSGVEQLGETTMAREGISKAQVFEAADQISQAGQQPTVASVRAKLGTGSYTTITTMLRDWKNDVSKQEQSDELDVPEEVTTALGRAAQIVWKAATDHFSGELAAIRKETERHTAQYREDIKEATDEIAQLEEELHQLHAETVKHINRAAELNDIIATCSEDKIKLKSEISRLTSLLQVAQERIAEQSALLLRALPTSKNKAPEKPKGQKAPEADTNTQPLNI